MKDTKQFFKAMSKKQMESLINELLQVAIDTEFVSFHDDSFSPYWRHTGESVVPNMQTFDGT